MKVLNTHRRTIGIPSEKVGLLLENLASKDDQIWAFENWPKMRLDNGLNKESKGGHGLISYNVHKYVPNKSIKFEFTSPKGFHGFHGLDINPVSDNLTELIYTIEMKTNFVGTFQWITFIRSLHGALTEDAFDKIENHFFHQGKKTEYSLWVKIWRKILE